VYRSILSALPPREASGVTGPVRKLGAKTGPKPGTVMSHLEPLWTRDRVIRVYIVADDAPGGQT